MKGSTLDCRFCSKTLSVSAIVARFWHENGDIPYACPECMSERIHAAIIQCDIAKFQAVTCAYQTVAAMNQRPQIVS